MNAATFFYKHAPYCYNPAEETEEQGKRRNSRALADAERWLENQPYCRFTWFQDRGKWACQLWERGEILASLYDCETGPDHEYHRVVEAELALEVMPRVRHRPITPAPRQSVFGSII